MEYETIRLSPEMRTEFTCRHPRLDLISCNHNGPIDGKRTLVKVFR